MMKKKKREEEEEERREKRKKERERKREGGMKLGRKKWFIRGPAYSLLLPIVDGRSQKSE